MEYKKVARELAEEGAVLLKNDDNTLPLDFEKYKNILILAQEDRANNNPYSAGDGSGHVSASYVQTPLNEIAERFGVDSFVSKENEV